MTSDLVFVRLYPPRPLTAAALESLLRRLATDPTSTTLVLEARSEHDAATKQVHVSYWLGSHPEHARWIRRTLRDLLPGMVVDTSPIMARQPVQTAARVKVQPPGLALASDQPEAISLAILSALAQRLGAGEQLVLQFVLGPRRSPRHPRQRLADPAQPWWQRVMAGQKPAPTVVARQHTERVARPGMAVCVRLGVSAEGSERRKRLLVGLLGGLSTAKAPGVFISLHRESAGPLNAASPPRRWEFAPASTELVGLLAWPLGERDLPGLASLHPRLLPASPALRTGSSSQRVLGESAVPGDPTPIRVTAADSLLHLVATGVTGSGKSTALLHLIAEDIRGGQPVVAIDPKRQLIDDIIDRAVPAERMDDVVILDPSETVVPGFNPLDIGDRDPDVVVDGLLAVFATVFSDGWGPRTQDITHAGLASLARASAEKRRHATVAYTLLDLPHLFTDATFRRSVVGHVAHDPGLGAFWAWYESLSPQGQAAALAAPSNKWRQYLMRPTVRRMLGQANPRFRLRDVFRDKKIVLMPLNDGLIGPITAQLLGGLVVAELWAATLERAIEPTPTSRPASIWIDEAQMFIGGIPTSLEDALAASRSMGVSWNLAHQFRAQMPPTMLAAIDSNARNKLVFRPNDPKDAAAYDRMVPELQARDFLSLGRFEAYATVVTNGAQQPWCSLRTRPAPEPTGLGATIRLRSQQAYGGVVEPVHHLDETTQPPSAGPIGRRRRGAQT